MASQKPKVLGVTVVTAGVPVRVVSDAESPYRYVRSAFFRPADSNVGAVYVGDAGVSSSLYTDALVGSEKDCSTWEGDWVSQDSGNRFNYIDLYNVWVDAGTSGSSVFVTVFFI